MTSTLPSITRSLPSLSGFMLPVLLPATLSAGVLHVSPTGDDTGPGTASMPWATLQHAADMAVAGDTVMTHPGIYTGFAAMDHSGTSIAPIVFTTNGGVTIDEPCQYNGVDGINVEGVSWVVIEGFIVHAMPRAGIRTALSDHVTIRYNTCTDNGVWGILTGFAEHVIIEHNTCSGSVDEHGIYFSNSADHPVIRYNHCFGNNACGIHMNGDESMGGDGIISDALVYGNIVHGNGTAGGSGINCDGVVNSAIYNNLLYDNHASGISLYRIDGGGPSTGNKVWNNTIINASDARWCLNIADLCTDNSVLNNILINQHPWRGSIAIAADALIGFSSDHNIVVNSLSPDGDATILDLSGWQALGYDANSQVANPMAVMFADAIGGDFQAVGPGAQQVDAGTNAVAAWVVDDVEGNPRPMGATYDIGSHEAGFVATWTAQPERSMVDIRALDDVLILVCGAIPGSEISISDAMGRTIHRSTILDNAQRIGIHAAQGMIAVQVRDPKGGSVTTTKLMLLR